LSPPVSSRRPELRSLTGLRFLAAFLVLAYHALFSFPSASLRLAPGPVRSVLASGYVGVSLFFVLSGFVLAYAYVDGGVMTTPARTFWRARFSRVYPVYLAGLLAAVPLYAAAWRANHVAEPLIVREMARQLAITGALLQAWLPADVFDLDGPSWSLSVEAFFYACFPLLVRALGRLRTTGLWGLLAVAWVATVIPAIALGSPATGVESASTADLVVLFNPVARLPEFLIGVAAGLLFLRRPTPDRRGGGVWRAVALACAMVIFAVLSQSERLPSLLLHEGLLDPLWALLVFSLACSGGSRNRGLGRAPWVVLGRASYSLYILHKPLFYWLERWTGGGPVPSARFLMAYVATSIALSTAVWWGCEEPLRRRLAAPGRAEGPSGA
jgi:peptidoglycan/LPS O-acetylase OafA/YrhL